MRPMLHCNITLTAYVQRTMSKQLSLAAAASIFAMSALALLAPNSAHPSDAFRTGSASSFAAPTVELPSLLGD